MFDSLGGVIYLRDINGNNVNSYTYDEWGRILTKTEGVYNPIRYASYWYDDYTNLYHLGARWYDPTLYRFISVDPHPGDQDDSLSLNEYLYTANNPIIRTDPKGDKWNPIDKLADWMYQQGYGDAANYLYDNNKYWRFALDHPYLTGAIVGVVGGLTFAGATLVLGGSFTCGAICGSFSKVSIDGLRGLRNLLGPKGNTRILQIRGKSGKPVIRIDFAKIGNKTSKKLHIDTAKKRHIPIKWPKNRRR